MTLVAPRRPAVRTYLDRGREVYADTGRAVEELLGSHVVLWIVEDAEAWAKAIEAEADAEAAGWPRRDRGLAEFRRAQQYESAAQIRAEGPRRDWRGHCHGLDAAQAEVAELYRAHPNPGVRYELAEITEAGACPGCHQPMIRAEGQWRHHCGGYLAECHRPGAESAEEEPRRDGEWEIGTAGYMIVCPGRLPAGECANDHHDD